MTSLLESVLALADRASEAILAIAAGGVASATKDDGSPVTRADRASDEILRDGLAGLAGGAFVLTEESFAAPPAGLRRYWCVDPLDGTKEFIRGLDEFTVNVALIEDGEPILGVVTVPARRAAYWAFRGGGAWRRQRSGAPERLGGAPAAGADLDAVVSRSHLSPETQSFLDRLGVRRVRPMGSSAKICAVAEGSADIYPRLGPTWYWDSAAGAAIAREAGCRVVDADARDLSYPAREPWKHPAFIVYRPGRIALEKSESHAETPCTRAAPRASPHGAGQAQRPPDT
jgi:3'(2'), 5'-bisphosphate nucleotidase